MNIVFSYLYRDGANYKQFKELIFSNPLNRELKEIESLIKVNLIDGLWFVADDWKIPNQFFKEYPWDEKIDHTWHEFDGIKETIEPTTENNTIENLIELVKNTKSPF